jgi:hypothetical protein
LPLAEILKKYRAVKVAIPFIAKALAWQPPFGLAPTAAGLWQSLAAVKEGKVPIRQIWLLPPLLSF